MALSFVTGVSIDLLIDCVINDISVDMASASIIYSLRKSGPLWIHDGHVKRI